MSYVKLRNNHLEAIIEITQLITDYKYKALKKHGYEIYLTDYLPKLLEQISKNEFRCFRRDDSTFTWLIDQICHCRVLIDGVPVKDGLLLCDTDIGQRVIEICRHATMGQNNYNNWYSDNQFGTLFD